MDRRKFLRVPAGATVLAAATGLQAGSAVGRKNEEVGAMNSIAPIVSLNAADLSVAIKAKHLSCVEVMTAYLSHIQQHNPKVGALVSLRSEESLLAEAAAKDKELAAGNYQGWMHGFPHAVKDLADAKGLITTSGSPIFANNVAKTDTVYVSRIKRAGAIIIGKTNVPEFGLGSQSYNPVFGATGNAWDHSLTAGGSSGGAAVGLAMRMLPVADGSDYMGSLRNPAAFNNVIGFRPSTGLVPLSESYIEELPCNGPMGRNVQDTALLLSTMAGYDRSSPTSLPIDPAQFLQPLSRGGKKAASWKGTRIGWLGDLGGYLPMEAGVIDLCEKALGGFRDIGCEVEEASLDHSLPELWQTWLTFRHWLVRSKALPLYSDRKLRKQLKPEAKWEVTNGARLTADDVARASADRARFYQALLSLFDRYEYLVLPTAQVFPFAKTTHWPKTINDTPMDTYHRWMEVVTIGTLSGCPVINVPAGFNAEGLPMGLQIISKRYADFAALQIAAAYEEATRWNLDRVPPSIM